MRGISTREEALIQKWRAKAAAEFAPPNTSKGFYSLGRAQKRSQAKHRRIERQTGIR